MGSLIDISSSTIIPLSAMIKVINLSNANKFDYT